MKANTFIFCHIGLAEKTNSTFIKISARQYPIDTMIGFQANKRANKLLKTIILFISLSCFCSTIANAQISENQLQPFLNGFHLVEASGDGLKQSSGDILLELVSDEQDDYETLALLHNEQGKLSKIAENANLLVSKELLGVSGGNYPSLSSNILSVDYTLGSNSASSDISIQFEKNKDGQYYFKEYTVNTQNYGVENLFAREKITAAQTGTISFSETSEEKILAKGVKNPIAAAPDEPLYKATHRFEKYIPEGFQLAAFAEGDLDLDNYKKDLLLVFYNEETCSSQLLTQQKDDSYKIAQTNNTLLVPNETFNINNLKAVVKNGFFTLEQRVPIGDDDFDHRYITFKYDATQKNWFLHRFDVEHYSGFNPKPSENVTHLTKNEFGTIAFQHMEDLPGIYKYEPALSAVSGKLVKKQFYGRPNYGETPERDEKVWVYILKLDYPVSVVAAIDQPDAETADKSIANLSEVQVYSTDQNIDFKTLEGREIKLRGVFQPAQTGHHYTKVLLEVKKIL